MISFPPWSDHVEGPTKAEALKAAMIDSQLRRRGIEDQRLLDAFTRVPRHHFVEGADLAACYGDYPLPIPCGQTISQPYVVAVTLHAARIAPHHRVLEIGAGSGYQTALLAELAKEVCALEFHEELVRSARARLHDLGYANVDLRRGDGHEGWPEAGARFNAIVVAAAAPRIPEPLMAQLIPGGRLVMPVGKVEQELLCVHLTDSGIETTRLLPVRFVPLLGES